ncbi:APC family permease [Bombilactobacillus folatiphilus]|uniref:APC family permease n=1 Tax=Bombilactobacillus folatiphilus TaxID=2923362 RepID=A0ABY4PAR6_9LACO|nr:APC family permease [Bombilactobacillus folatiphilus]UQS82843.1 APC family permease [Bombilactobacillus folatiphilus]
MLALGSLIGSGWLFGAWEASAVAGPAAIISWILGAIIIGAIAYNYIELGTMFPESGGMSKFAQYSHGSLLGFIAAWANWISLITLLPIEAVAAVQYMSAWPFKWAHFTNQFMHNNTVTNRGLIMVFIFIIIFTLLNYWSVALLTHFTSAISLFKIAIPLLTVILLTISSFHPANYGHTWHSFMPYGSAPIFAATSVSGIIFSFDAFQTVINMGNEVRNPQKNIGRAITISLSISAVIYILLQSTFITSMTPHMLCHGWQGINFNSPFADLAILLNIYWLAILLYLDAFVSPFGTGVSFTASTSRALAAMVDNEHLPKFLGKLNQKYHTPRTAMVIDALLSMVMVGLFRSWASLATVICTSTLIAYLTGPTTVVALRKLAPHFKRPIVLKHLKLMAPLAFILTSLAIYWGMWPTTIQVIFIITLGLPIYFYYEAKAGWQTTKQELQGAAWLICYLIFMAIMSFIGSRQFNGQNWLHYPYDFLIIILCSGGFYYWGTHSYWQSRFLNQGYQINRKIKKETLF